jgi:hypothetical protein
VIADRSCSRAVAARAGFRLQGCLLFYYNACMLYLFKHPVERRAMWIISLVDAT